MLSCFSTVAFPCTNNHKNVVKNKTRKVKQKVEIKTKNNNKTENDLRRIKKKKN